MPLTITDEMFEENSFVEDSKRFRYRPENCKVNLKERNKISFTIIV